MKSRQLLSLVMLLVLSSSAWAHGKARVNVLTHLDDVQACEPLRRGKVLLGTSGGLVLLGSTGKRERLWTRLHGLPGTRVHALLKEGDTLWVGTDRGLARLSISRGSIEQTFASKPVRAIERHLGMLYLGTWDAGLLRLDAGRLVRAHAEVKARAYRPAEGRITALHSMGATLYIGTAGAGLWRLARNALEQTSALPRANVWSLAGAGKDRLYVGTLTGLWRLETDASPITADALSSADARALHRLDHGRILVGSYGAPLHQITTSRGVAAAEAFSSLGVAYVNVIRSRHGTTCIGTRSGTWIQDNSHGSTPRHTSLAGPPSNDISALAMDGERLYVGTFDGGVAYFEAGSWYSVRGIDQRIDVLAVQHAAGKDRQATLWVGTPRGLYRVRGNMVKHFGKADGLYHQHVHSLAILRDGMLAVGTARGAALIRGDHVETINVKGGLPVASVWAIAEDRNGELFFGTSRGLYHWSRGRRRYTRYSVSSGHLEEDWVTAIKLHKGALYVGSYNAGVVKLTRAAHGGWASTPLGGGWVNFFGLEIVNDTLYSASMNGLHRLALPVMKGSTFQHLAKAAPGRDVTGVVAAPGGLWIGSRRGLVFRPSKTLLPTSPTPLR